MHAEPPRPESTLDLPAPERGHEATPHASAEALPQPSWLRKNAATVLASIAVTVGFIWLLKAGALPVLPPADALAQVRWWTIPAYTLIWFTILILRSLRWKILLDSVYPVSAKRVILVSLIGFAALVILPFRAGEFVRPAMIRRKGQISGWAATGTVGAERIIDGLVLSLILLATLKLAKPVEPMPDHIGDLPVPVAAIPVAAGSAGLLFAVAFLVMTLFYLRREWARRILERVVGRISARLGQWAAHTVDGFTQGFGFLAQPRYGLPFFGVTLFHWALNAFSIWVIVHGCGMDALSPAQACVALGVQGLGTLLPNAPGFFGAFQISMYAALALYFAPAVVVGPGAAAVFILYVLNIGTTLVAGAAAFWINRRTVELGTPAPL